MYTSKMASTEKALEHTYSLLNNLQIEVSSMTNDVESAQLKDEAYYKQLFLDLSNKVGYLFLKMHGKKLVVMNSSSAISWKNKRNLLLTK